LPSLVYCFVYLMFAVSSLLFRLSDVRRL
jgi:hypothetical protein